MLSLNIVCTAVIKFGLSSKHKIQEKLRSGLVLLELYCFALYIYLTAIKKIPFTDGISSM